MKIEDVVMDMPEHPDHVEDIITDVVPTEIHGDPEGVIRTSTGQFQQGTKSPPSAFHQRNKNLIKNIEKKCGNNADTLVQKLINIAMYDPEQQEKYVDKEDGLTKYRKKSFHFYNSQTQLAALTLLMKYVFGNPRKEVQIDKNVDIKIEKKVADLTRLINDNQDRLQIINGGR